MPFDKETRSIQSKNAATQNKQTPAVATLRRFCKSFAMVLFGFKAKMQPDVGF